MFKDDVINNLHQYIKTHIKEYEKIIKPVYDSFCNAMQELNEKIYPELSETLKSSDYIALQIELMDAIFTVVLYNSTQTMLNMAQNLLKRNGIDKENPNAPQQIKEALCVKLSDTIQTIANTTPEQARQKADEIFNDKAH